MWRITLPGTMLTRKGKGKRGKRSKGRKANASAETKEEAKAEDKVTDQPAIVRSVVEVDTP